MQQLAQRERNDLDQFNVKMILEDYMKEDLHELLTRNGFYLPYNSKCSWLSKKIMIAMFLGDTWCPKYRQVQPKPCPRPPTRKILVEELNKEINRQHGSKKMMPFTDSRMPD